MDPTWGLAGAMVLGGLMNSKAVRDANTTSVAFSKEMAQKGIQWRVEDAKEAGVHPLAALGANVAGNAPLINPTSPGSGIQQAALMLATRKGEEEINLLRQQAVAAKADATKSLAEAKRLGGPRGLYIKVFDQKSGKIVDMIDPELAESMDSMGANALNIRGLFTTDKAVEAQVKAERRKYVQQVKGLAAKGKVGMYRKKVSDGTGGYKYHYFKSPYVYAAD
jgi:hypothetical protein